MAVRGRIGGVSGREGVYLTGRPQQLIACDDGLVLVPAAGRASLLGGPLAGSVLTRQVAAEVDRSERTAAALGAALRRARQLGADI